MQIETSEDDLFYLAAAFDWDPDYERAVLDQITLYGRCGAPDRVLRWSSEGDDAVIFKFLRRHIEDAYEDVIQAYERNRNADLKADIYAAKVKERLT